MWQFFEERARGFLNHRCLTFADQHLTFRAAFDLAQRLALDFTKNGVDEQSTVALCLPNNASFVPSVLSLMKIGARIALVSPKYRKGELEAIFNGLGPNFVLSDESFMTMVGPHFTLTDVSDVNDVSPVVNGLLLGRLRVPQKPEAPGDTLLFKVTSGSTGNPKLVALSGANVVAAAQIVQNTMQCTASDAILCVTPMCHSYAFDLGVLAALASGATLKIHNSFVPRQVLREIQQPDVTIFLGVPAIYRTFVDMRGTSLTGLSHLRYLLSCTAPLSSQVISAFHQRYGVPICQHYGSSETGAVTMHIPDEVLQHSGSVGVAMQGVSIQIVDANGSPAPAGTEGQIIVTSSAVASGYVMPGSNISSLFSGGSFRMGDMGMMDPSGFLHLGSRRDDIINVGGFKVSPHEITRVLESCPTVREAAVLGVKDSTGETTIYAAVTVAKPATEHELLRYCRDQLAEYKMPRRIDILKEIPRGPSGKLNLRAEDVKL